MNASGIRRLRAAYHGIRLVAYGGGLAGTAALLIANRLADETRAAAVRTAGAGLLAVSFTLFFVSYVLFVWGRLARRPE